MAFSRLRLAVSVHRLAVGGERVGPRTVWGRPLTPTMRPSHTVVLTLAIAASACAQEAPPVSPVAADLPSATPAWYAPPATAERWAPELHSEDGWTFTPTFTPDLRTVVYTRWDAPDFSAPETSIQVLLSARWDEAAASWTTPEALGDFTGWRVDWPHVSPNGRRLLLSTNKPHAGHFGFEEGRRLDDFDLWGAERLDDGPGGEVRWGAFAPLRGDDLNRQKTPSNARIRYVHNETSPRLDRDGTLYFWTERLDDAGGRRDTYRAGPDGEGGFRTPELLPFNTPERESGIAVDPEGRFVVFASEGLGGAGNGDLFLSARQGDGWAEPVNLGPSVNTAADEGAPEISPDGRALFFTSDRRVPGVGDVDSGEGTGPPIQVFWVDLLKLDSVRAAAGAE